MSEHLRPEPSRSRASPAPAARLPRPRRRRSPTSLKRRITRDTAVLVTLVLAAMALASSVALRTILIQQETSQLRAAAIRAQDVIRSRAAPVVTEEQIRAATPAGSFVLCLGADDEVLTSNLPSTIDQRQLLSRVRAAGPGVPVALRGTNPPVRTTLLPLDASTPLTIDVDGQVRSITTMVIGFDTSRGERLLHRTILLEIGFTAMAGLIILLLLPRTVEGGLTQIHQMSDAARAVAGGDTRRRLPLDADITEAVVLAHAVNDALDARQEAENRLRQFVADASHELRTPLTIIDGWAELHRQGGLGTPELVAHAMDRIADSATHLTALVEDLVLLARLDTGRPIELRPVDLSLLAETVLDDIRVVDPGRPVTFTGPADGEPDTVVRGDEQRLRQIILNLAGNALQHTAPATPLDVDVHRHDEQVILTVSDQGPGIPPEHQARIFNRFYRGSATRATKGTGLGLAIVWSLVQAHGGEVSVVSGPRGTSFTVMLPADPRP